MSMPLNSALQSQITTGNRFPYHPKAGSELIHKYERTRLNTENIYLLPLVSGSSYNHNGKSVVEIRELDIGRKHWPFNYVTEAYRESGGVTTTGRTLYRNLEITSASGEICGGICKKTHAATELAEGLRLNLSMKSPFDPVGNYMVHEIALDPGYNVSGYAGATVGYVSALPVFQTKGWTNEQPRINIYIDQAITVSGVANSPGFAFVALPNANIELGNDPTIDIEAYPGTAKIHVKMGYKVIPGDEDAPPKRMILQLLSLPELFELRNGGWSYVGK